MRTGGRSENAVVKRFLLFAGSIYYPTGGWGDFVNSYNTELEATQAAACHQCDWWEIVDIESVTLVAEDALTTLEAARRIRG